MKLPKCPKCGSPVKTDGKYLYCSCKTCSYGKMPGRVPHAKRIEVEGRQYYKLRIIVDGKARTIRYSVNERGCWIHECEYPSITVSGKSVLLHRYLFSVVYPGINIENRVIRHKCDNPLCINPIHLLPGTHADNVRDRVERGRSAIGENHGRSKLTEADVICIRMDNDTSIHELAREYGVDRKAIRKIKQGITWKHVA